MNNPIIDNRIVSDITFATRSKHFIEQEAIKNIASCDCSSFEEWEYLRDVARDLLRYQKETLTDGYELEYLIRTKKG